MLERVRQCLLRNSEDCQLDTRRQPLEVAFDIYRDGDARRVDARDEVIQPLQGRLRLEQLRGLLTAQHAEQPAHLDKRLTPGCRDALDSS